MTEDLTSPKDNQPEESSKPGKAKKTRRGHGEGSIYRRASDGRFAASLTIEDPETGKSKRKTFYGKTKAEVRAKLEQAKLERQKGTLATGPQQKVSDFLTRWLEDAHKLTIRLTSYDRYRKHLKNHILPALGHHQLQRLTHQHVQAFVAQLQKKGLAPTSIHSIYSMLHRALEDAVEWHLIPRNVSEKVKLPPKIVQRKAQTITFEQAKHLFTVARDFHMEVVLILAITSGMREGELLGLRWADIDFTEGSVYVCHTISYVVGYGYVESKPKTEKSKSKILLPQITLEMLKKHRVQQEKERLNAGNTWQNRDLVFCTAEGGFIQPSSLHRRLQTVLKAAGLPRMRVHDLRHSTATILLAMGIHPKIVQDVLRHSRMSTTMDTYTHVLPAMQKEAMDKMDDLFGG